MPVLNPKILAVAKTVRSNIFVESGTCKGASFILAAESGIFSKCYSVEIEPALYERLMQRLPNTSLRKIFLGNSIDVFEKKIFPLCGPNDNIFFWLDGHYSEGPTGGAEFPCPLLGELESIKKFSPTRNVTVAIDDTDDFRLTHKDIPGFNWPSRKEIMQAALDINPRFSILDYTGSGALPKINRGILIFTTGKVDSSLKLSLNRIFLMTREYKLNFFYKIKRRVSKDKALF